MGAKSGFALKFLQWFIRGVQFCCCALTLALFSYFLASASRHNQPIPTWARAVEGISGIGVIYTAAALLLLCCLAGYAITSFLAIVIDIAFVGAFIYVAQANRGGAGSCRGDVNTLFGEGVSNTSQNGLAEFGTICRMQSAVLAVSIVAIFFFIFSAIMEFVLVRHRRKERAFGPSPGNNYTSGYAKRGGLFGLFGRKKTAPQAQNPNALPMHTTPDQVRDSYATESTAVGAGHHGGANGYKQSYEATGPNAYRHEPVTGGYGNTTHDGRTAYPETGVQSGVTGGQSGYRF